MRSKYLEACFFLFFSLLSVLSFSQHMHATRSYEPGFKIVHSLDSSRIYKPNSSLSDYLHYRPLDLDIWYPAHHSPADTNLAFRDFLSLLEKRATYYTASSAGQGITRQIAQSLCDVLKCSDTSRLLQSKTHSLKHARPAKGKFPLVVYMASYNGMCYENIKLFEDLTRKGFVVVSISSIGRYPGDMTMKKEDLMEQVADARFAVDLLSKDPNIDASKVGIVGYSWGGLAGVMLAGSIRSAVCLVSLDGSEYHHYDQAQQENQDFDDLKSSAAFKGMHISVPYLRLQSAPAQTAQTDSVYDFSVKLSNKKTILVVEPAHHEDFSCLPTLVFQSGRCNYNETYSAVLRLTEGFLEEHLKGKNTFASDLKLLGKSVKRM